MWAEKCFVSGKRQRQDTCSVRTAQAAALHRCFALTLRFASDVAPSVHLKAKIQAGGGCGDQTLLYALAFFCNARQSRPDSRVVSCLQRPITEKIVLFQLTQLQHGCTVQRQALASAHTVWGTVDPQHDQSVYLASNLSVREHIQSSPIHATAMLRWRLKVDLLGPSPGGLVLVTPPRIASVYPRNLQVIYGIRFKLD